MAAVAGCRGIGISASYSSTKRFQWTYLQSLSQLSRSKGLDISISDIRPCFVSTDFIHADYPMKMRPDYVAEHSRYFFCKVCKDFREMWIFNM